MASTRRQEHHPRRGLPTRAEVWEVSPFVPLLPRSRHAFSYTAPREGEKVAPGMLVRIPFGPRTVTGLVVRSRRGKPLSGTTLKPISSIVSPRPLFPSFEVTVLERLAELSLESFALMAKSAARVREPLAKERVPLDHAPSTRSAPRSGSHFQMEVRWEPIVRVLPKDLDGQVLLLAPEMVIAEKAHVLLQARHLPSAVFAQGLPLTERRAILSRLARGESLAVVATHAGIFLPLPALREIIVLEAALASHRQWDLHPRYDARVAAVLLAQTHRVPLTFQSTFPSLDLTVLGHAGVGRRGSPLIPRWEVRPRASSDPLLPPETLTAIQHTVDAGGSVFLFHDVVGTERAFTCATCRLLLRCRVCGGILEREHASLRCRTCGDVAGPVPHFCPQCRSPHIAARRFGTAFLERELTHVLGAVPTDRADRQTLPRTRPGELPRPPAARIVIGTERAFAALTPETFHQVVVIAADRILEGLRFDAEERFAILLSRLASLARPGAPLLLQTTHPHLPVVRALALGNFGAWAEAELRDRRMLGYPPFLALLRIERPFPSSAKATRASERFLPRARSSTARLSTGFRLRMESGVPTERRRVVADLLLRGPLPALYRVLTSLPAGWSADPYVPLSLLKGSLVRNAPAPRSLGGVGPSP